MLCLIPGVLIDLSPGEMSDAAVINVCISRRAVRGRVPLIITQHRLLMSCLRSIYAVCKRQAPYNPTGNDSESNSSHDDKRNSCLQRQRSSDEDTLFHDIQW